jgi:hypothetical protein
MAMSKFVLLQAFYCITGILFFVRDMLAKVPMGVAMLNAFIWPYAQWLVIKYYAVQMLIPVLDLIHQ